MRALVSVFSWKIITVLRFYKERNENIFDRWTNYIYIYIPTIYDIRYTFTVGICICWCRRKLDFLNREKSYRYYKVLCTFGTKEYVKDIFKYARYYNWNILTELFIYFPALSLNICHQVMQGFLTIVIVVWTLEENWSDEMKVSHYIQQRLMDSPS